MLLVDSLQRPHQPRNADTEGFAIQNKKSVLSQENRAMPHRRIIYYHIYLFHLEFRDDPLEEDRRFFATQ